MKGIRHVGVMTEKASTRIVSPIPACIPTNPKITNTRRISVQKGNHRSIGPIEEKGGEDVVVVGGEGVVGGGVRGGFLPYFSK